MKTESAIKEQINSVIYQEQSKKPKNTLEEMEWVRLHGWKQALEWVLEE